MRPIFTIHSGEYLVASHIENKFKGLNVWVPSKDNGVDLLVTDDSNRKAISFQVKFSKDFLQGYSTDFLRSNLTAFGWWTINRDKLKKSKADLWVFVLMSFHSRDVQYVVIPPKELLEVFTAVHGDKPLWQIYLTVTKQNRCWETRGLSKEDMISVAKDEFVDQKRDFCRWLDNWGKKSDPIFSLMAEK